MVGNNDKNKQIADGILNGDPKIYSYIDKNFREKVILFVCSKSGSKADGKELYYSVVYEIYLNVKEGKYDASKGSFKGYFMAVARNRWFDRLRGQQRKGGETISIYDKNTPEIPHYDHPIGEEDLESIKARAIKKHLSNLAEEDQLIIRMFYFARKSLNEIAEYLGINANNARQKLYRARERLRKLIKNDPEFGISLF